MQQFLSKQFIKERQKEKKSKMLSNYVWWAERA
jgi:hypothetical protein